MRCYHVGIVEGLKVHCEEEGKYGLRKGDPTVHFSEWLQKARYCKKHKHYDDVLIKEKKNGDQ